MPAGLKMLDFYVSLCQSSLALPVSGQFVFLLGRPICPENTGRHLAVILEDFYLGEGNIWKRPIKCSKPQH